MTPPPPTPYMVRWLIDDLICNTDGTTVKASNAKNTGMTDSSSIDRSALVRVFHDITMALDSAGHVIVAHCYFQFQYLLERIERKDMMHFCRELKETAIDNASEDQRATETGHHYLSEYKTIPGKVDAFEDGCWPEEFSGIERSARSLFCLPPPTAEKQFKRMVKHFRKNVVKAVRATPAIADLLLGHLMIHTLENCEHGKTVNFIEPVEVNSGSSGVGTREYYQRKLNALGFGNHFRSEDILACVGTFLVEEFEPAIPPEKALFKINAPGKPVMM